MEKENEELIKNIRNNTKTGRPLGKESFVKKIESLTGKSFTFKQKGRFKKW